MTHAFPTRRYSDLHEVDLIQIPPKGYYGVTATKDKIVRMNDANIKDEERAKSFHLDTYCFHSGSENWLFWDLLREQRVKKIYFTGMLTHGQSDFFIQYITPDSHRSEETRVGKEWVSTCSSRSYTLPSKNKKQN